MMIVILLLIHIINTHAPVKTNHVPNRVPNLWMTEELLNNRSSIYRSSCLKVKYMIHSAKER